EFATRPFPARSAGEPGVAGPNRGPPQAAPTPEPAPTPAPTPAPAPAPQASPQGPLPRPPLSRQSAMTQKKARRKRRAPASQACPQALWQIRLS
ncbi:hypothetical protein F3N43_01835, partial [Alkalilimnicola sp. S0819]